MAPDAVLITGGTGVVGRPLLERLVADGREVRALARSAKAVSTIEALAATAVRGDVLDQASLRAAAEGCATVFHVAGVNATCQRRPGPMIRANIEGSANAIRAASEAGVGRMVYTSSASTIGEPRGTVGDETTQHRGSYLSAYERSKHLAERSVLALAERLQVDVVCVNPSSVQGPGRSTGSAELLIRAVSGRVPVLVDAAFSIVDVRDCVEGHLRAEARGTPGERYILSGATLTTTDAVEIVRGLWGRPERVRWVPPAVAVAGGALVELTGRLAGRDVPVCRETVRTLLHGHRYDASKAERELGVRYTPVEETFERTLEWLSERGLVPPRAERGPTTRR